MISLIDALMVVSINCNKLVSAGFCCSMGLRTPQPRLLQAFGMGVCPWNLSVLGICVKKKINADKRNVGQLH